jgi:hypothetical protein
MSGASTPSSDLQALLKAVKSIPASWRNGVRGNLIAKHLSPSLDDGSFPTHPQGSYYAFSKSWERAFFLAPNKPKASPPRFALVPKWRRNILPRR